MSFVTPFTVKTVDLYVATINDKSWARAREVYKVLEYRKANKTADFVKHLRGQENFGNKCQLTSFVSAMHLMNWPKDSRKNDYYYINEERIYDLLLSSQQPEVNHYRRHYCNVLIHQF